ncbi:MAG: hypothetical protein JWM18_1247 [Chloroflexi bacterium]|nr:hypothetical protein [Chloroflexota bacterium]
MSTLGELLRDFERSAFRLEALDRYLVEEEEPSFAAFLRGEPQPPDDPGFDAWLDGLRQKRAAGKEMVRVHVIVGPLTPYLRYELEWGYSMTVPAGEDVRILHRPSWEDTPFGRQPSDFWLLDDKVAAVMHYAPDGQWLGADIVTESAEVGRCRSLRDLAVSHSVPLRDYLAALRSLPVDPSGLLPRHAEDRRLT